MDAPATAFARLRQLLSEVPAPSGLDPIPLHLGEVRYSVPALDTAPLASAHGWARYPPLGGTDDLRRAYAGWLERRFAVARSVADHTIAFEPTPGTKQAVSVCVALAVRASSTSPAERPPVVLPNPFYPPYHVATKSAEAASVFYGVDGGAHVTGIAAALDRAGGRAAAVVVCNPGSPGGEILSDSTLREIAALAKAAGALLIVDECYSDLSLDRVPPGVLSIVEEGAVDFGRFVVLHSLSKRSAAPGLRSGFMAGDRATVATYAVYNRACGVSSASPVCAAAAALWSDDEHVKAVCDALARSWALADAILGDIPGYRRAESGLFVWLPVVDDEQTALDLWERQAVSVMPGRYLATEDTEGVNPGRGYVRIALVHDDDVMREALVRVERALTLERELTA